MADVTVNIPITVTGQTASFSTWWRRDTVWLGNNRFISIYDQISPNRTYACIFTVDNIKTSSPTVTILRNQVLLDLQTTSSVGATYRLIRLSDTQVMCLREVSSTVYTLDFSILEIDAVTNVITRINLNNSAVSYSFSTGGVNLVNTQYSLLMGANVATYINSVGLTYISLAIITYKRINNSVVLISIPQLNSAASLTVLKLTWNNTTKIITQTQMMSTTGNAQYGYTTFIDNITGGGLTLFTFGLAMATGIYNANNACSWVNYATLTAAQIADINNVNTLSPVSKGFSSVPSVGFIVEDSAQTSYAVFNNNQYGPRATLSNSTTNFSSKATVNPLINFSTSSTLPPATDLIYLDNNKVLIVTNSGIVNASPTVSLGQWSWGATNNLRIFDYQNFNVTSNTSITISITGLTPVKFSFVEKISNSIVVITGHNAAATGMCSLRFLYIK